VGRHRQGKAEAEAATTAASRAIGEKRRKQRSKRAGCLLSRCSTGRRCADRRLSDVRAAARARGSTAASRNSSRADCRCRVQVEWGRSGAGGDAKGRSTARAAGLSRSVTRESLLNTALHPRLGLCLRLSCIDSRGAGQKNAQGESRTRFNWLGTSHLNR
jgi:hypothetical protein